MRLGLFDDCRFYASVCLVVSSGCSSLTCGSSYLSMVMARTLAWLRSHGKDDRPPR